MTEWQQFDERQYRGEREYRVALRGIEALKRKLALAERDGRKTKVQKLQDKLEDTLFAVMVA